MERLSAATRREILLEKLRGASNRETADSVGVSKGTVANVIDEARNGEFDAYEDLDQQIDALLSLSKQLEEASLNVKSAQTGLEVLQYLNEMDLAPDEVGKLRKRLSELANGQGHNDAFTNAASDLCELEERTGMDVEGRLGDLLRYLALKDTDELDFLDSTVEKVETLAVGSSGVDAAIESAIKLRDMGFDLDTAEAVSAELAEIGDVDERATITTLAERYEEYESLASATDELEEQIDAMEVEIEKLQRTRSDLRDERNHLRASISRLERTLEAYEETLESLDDSKDQLEETLERKRIKIKRAEEEYVEVSEELEAVQAEREVVHAYRRFLKDSDLSEPLINDIATLVGIESKEDQVHVEGFEQVIRENVQEGLLETAAGMLEGEPMMPVSEHERKLREGGKTEQTLAELESERDAVFALLGFLETGDLSEDVLQELLEAKQGRANHLDSWEERKTEEVQQYLTEQLAAMTSDRAVVDEARHQERVEEVHDEYRSELTDTYDSLIKLSQRVRTLEKALDDEWIADLAAAVHASVEAGGELPSEDQISTVVRESLDEELSRRVEAECDKQVNEAFRRGLELGSAPGIVQVPPSTGANDNG